MTVKAVDFFLKYQDKLGRSPCDLHILLPDIIVNVHLFVRDKQKNGTFDNNTADAITDHLFKMIELRNKNLLNNSLDAFDEVGNILSLLKLLGIETGEQNEHQLSTGL
jgi:hypothetical protein